MNEATIIWKKAGHTIDDRYLLRVLKDRPSAIGTVVRMNDDLVVSHDRGVPDLETMKKAIEAARDFETMLWLAKIVDQDPLKQEDIQPFVFEQDGKNLLAIMVEGDFPKFAKPQSGTTDEGHFASDVIIPTLNDIAELANGDWDKFMEKLHGGLFEKQIMAHVGHRGLLTVMPCIGETMSLAQNELGAEYEWGAVSNHHGFDPKAEEEQAPKEEPKKKFSFFSGKSKAEETPVKEEPKKEEVKPVAVPSAPKTDTAVINNGKGQYVDIPEKLTGKARKAHIRKIMGLSSADKLPDGWHEKSFKAFIPEAKIKDLKELGQAVQSKSTVREALQTKGNVSEYPTKSDAIPVISEKQKLAVMDFVVKRLDANSNQTGDPTKMQQLEKNAPTFSEATGVNLEDLFKLSFKDFRDLADTYPVEMALMTMEFMGKYKDTLKVEEKQPEKVVETPPAVEEKKVAAGGRKLSFFNR